MELTVQQALHGYSDGHRLIAGSLNLESVDSRAMLVMSDLSGSGVRPGPNGYLTGYPLESAGKYVLARTWAAPEMPRPGCVWTHSLLIDNADLAALASAGGLMAAFRRPSGISPRSEYGSALAVASAPSSGSPGAAQRIREVVNAIYGAPDRAILVDAEDADEDEALAISIWMQQWPRLRRAFGFCTLAGMDRSAKGTPLDLQIARLTDRHMRSRFPSAALPAEIPHIKALDPLVDDLTGKDVTNVREFLRRTGGDVDGGRRAMIPLCRLHTSLLATSAPKLTEAVAALADLGGPGFRSARNVRTLVARRAIEQIDSVDDEVFQFLLETIDQTGLSDQDSFDASFGRALWLRAPARFLSNMAGDGPIAKACRRAIESMRLPDIVQGIDANPTLARTIVLIRPDLLERADFWRISSVSDDLVECVQEDAAAKVAWALAAAGRTAPSSLITSLADPGDLAAGLEAANATKEVNIAWLKALAWQPNKLAGALASGRLSRLSTLLDLAHATDPDAVPNDYGEDPWVIALRSATGSIEECDHDFLAAFMVSRAFGDRSRSKAALFRFGYGRLYRALQQSRLPWDVEKLVTWRLDWGSWFGWDNCSRLRETTVRNFVDGCLDPETFGRLTDDGALANSLIDEAARSGRGRRYLAEVRQTIRNAEEKGIRARADYIAKKIR